MSRTVVISQPMFFPWVGLLEQIRLADVFVHYDDVQFSPGSFVNRVQLKTDKGMRWMTIPLAGHHLGQRIEEVRANDATDWRARHLALFEQSYRGAPFFADALAMLRRVYDLKTDKVGELAKASVKELATYFELASGARPIEVRTTGVGGRSSQRVLDLVLALGGDTYVSGHGGYAYLDHAAFDAAGVTVAYMSYQKRAYPQLHGAFTPFVSGLDLVANAGKRGREVIASRAVPWKEWKAA